MTRKYIGVKAYEERLKTQRIFTFIFAVIAVLGWGVALFK